VRAASAVAALGDGFLVVQDDATHAAWMRSGSVASVRVLPAVEGHEVFAESAGTKHLKPDLEAACEVTVDGAAGVLMLGSGSSSARMRVALVGLVGGTPDVRVADLTVLYAAVAEALDVDADGLNLEGACVLGETLRWFHRGLPSAGLPSGSVDLPLDRLLDVVLGRAEPEALTVTNPRSYDLGTADGAGLAVTDAVCLPDGRILASAVAEDSPNARDDGPVVASALVLLDNHDVVDVAELPEIEGSVSKVEGLMLREIDGGNAVVRAVVDQDEPSTPSLCVGLRVRP
jgi:hypothetical protein